MSSLPLKQLSGAIDVVCQWENEKSIIRSQKHQGLLRTSRPMYGPSHGWPKIQIVHLGPGVMSGDSYEQSFCLHPYARMEIGFQSFTKVLPGIERSNQFTSVHMCEGSFVEILPNVTIPYPGSNLSMRTDIHLAKSSTAIFSEIVDLNLCKSQSFVELLSYRNVVQVYYDEKLCARDSFHLGRHTHTYGRGWESTHTVVGTLFLVRSDVDEELHTRLIDFCQISSGDCNYLGLTRIENHGYLMRFLGFRIQEMESLIRSASAIFKEKYVV